MNVAEKLNMDFSGFLENGAVNIVVFGDSVTHGARNGYNDYENVYHNVLKKKINAYKDSIPVNMINSGIGGVTAKNSLSRIQRDVISHHPDLCIVCFGLNDVNGTLEDYLNSMETIFKTLKQEKIDTIFMTPCTFNTYVAGDTPKQWYDYAKVTAEYQTKGKMDKYIYSAVEIAKKYGVDVCDCYTECKKIYESGKDITMMLINRINHPDQEIHNMFADMLFDMIIPDKNIKNNDVIETMYQE